MPDESDVKEGSRAGETGHRILAVALELFREKGFEATTMREIATKAGVATGAAYYYFPSKDAIVLAFYRQAMADMGHQLEAVLSDTTDLRKRLAGILALKLRYFEPSRRLFSALAAHADPSHPLSPFSDEAKDTREEDIAVFAEAVLGSKVHIADDLKEALPRLLWMYQMGLILYWIYDRSEGQQRSALLVDKSLKLVVKLIELSSLPLMRPLRRQVIEICGIASGLST